MHLKLGDFRAAADTSGPDNQWHNLVNTECIKLYNYF